MKNRKKPKPEPCERQTLSAIEVAQMLGVRRRGGTVPDDAFQGNWRAWLKYRRDLRLRKIGGVDIAKELEHTAPPAGDVARILLRRLDVLELWIASLHARRRRLVDPSISMMGPTSRQATPLAGTARDDRADPHADPDITADRERWRTDAALREEFAGNESAWLAYSAAERAGLLPPGRRTKRW